MARPKSAKEKREELAVFLNDILFQYNYELHQRNPGARQVTQTDFASRVLSVNPMSFSQWSRKERLPTGENVYLLAESLGKIKDEWGMKIFGILEIPVPVPVGAMDLIKAWKEADEETREEALDFLRKKQRPKKENPIETVTTT